MLPIRRHRAVKDSSPMPTGAVLTITHRIAIYQGVGPPICVEARGTVDGQTGLLIGFEGTFVLHNDARLIFRSG
jgi:hypothetical protein